MSIDLWIQDYKRLTVKQRKEETMGLKLLEDYAVERIDKLVPIAENFADEAMQKQHVHLTKGAPGKWPDAVKTNWNQVYHDRMDELVKAEGLRV